MKKLASVCLGLSLYLCSFFFSSIIVNANNAEMANDDRFVTVSYPGGFSDNFIDVGEIVSVDYIVNDEYTRKGTIVYIDINGFESKSEIIMSSDKPIAANRVTNNPTIIRGALSKAKYEQAKLDSQNVLLEENVVTPQKALRRAYTNLSGSKTYSKSQFTAVGSATFGFNGSDAYVVSNNWTYSLKPDIAMKYWKNFSSSGFITHQANCGVDYYSYNENQGLFFDQGTLQVFCSKDGVFDWYPKL